jgi:pyruvate kinase
MNQARQRFDQRARTKIVATVGPACASPQRLSELVAAGADVFRLNMAHGDREQHEKILANIQWASQQQDRLIGVLVDLAGPKIRLGTLLQDPLELKEEALCSFVRGAQSARPDELTTNYEPLVEELKRGDRVLLADGSVSLVVTEKTAGQVHCRVTAGGIVRSRQGVNLPGVKLGVPAMTERDLENAAWAADRQVDFVSLSFVRSAADVHALTDLLRSHGSQSRVIAKIEKPEALEQLEGIVAAAGGVMVARGDLGVEIDVAQTPMAQKRIIGVCGRLRKPVIVATQMLDSMQRSRYPTRAEVSDVANAILDGADACMLSGETAVGEFPRESVEMMNRIMLSTEPLIGSQPKLPDSGPASGVHPITAAVVFGAAEIAQRVEAQVVVIATRSGKTALVKAKQRDVIPTLAVSDSDATLRQATLFWGIEPLRGAPHDIGAGLLAFVDQWGRARGLLATGDRVVVVAGTGFETGAHNQVMVHEIP